MEQPRSLSLHLLVALILVTLSIASHAHNIVFNPIRLLKPKSGSAGHPVTGISCESWRLAVETNNIINWDVVPQQCEKYVGHYMLGGHYRNDSKAVCDVAAEYAESLNVTKGKDIWVFDIDETSLSNLPYYATQGFGADEYNDTSFNEWTLMGKSPALPETLKLYNKLISLGIKVAFITGKSESQRHVTTANLLKVGYKNWEKLVLRSASEKGTTAVVYKSLERGKLEKQGYTIVGNMGDQWSDITGTNVGKRTFKLPDPMYYIS